jgi:hypothetical protein
MGAHEGVSLEHHCREQVYVAELILCGISMLQVQCFFMCVRCARVTMSAVTCVPPVGCHGCEQKTSRVVLGCASWAVLSWLVTCCLQVLQAAHAVRTVHAHTSQWLHQRLLLHGCGLGTYVYTVDVGCAGAGSWVMGLDMLLLLCCCLSCIGFVLIVGGCAHQRAGLGHLSVVWAC